VDIGSYPKRCGDPFRALLVLISKDDWKLDAPTLLRKLLLGLSGA
jgi:hypothetical protein